MRFKISPQLPGAVRSRAAHHLGSHTPTSPRAILLSKMACQPKNFGCQCRHGVLDIFMDVGHTLEMAIFVVNQLKNDSYC